jgi:acyl dehydratase
MNDIRPGEEIPPFVVDAVRLEDIHTIMDVMGDVNPVHIDEDLVRRLGLRGLVNQGPANLGYVVNMLLRWTGDPSAIRRLAFRFHSISSPGDQLQASGTVTDVSSADGGSRVICDIRLDRGDGERVMSGTAELHVAAR